MKQPPSAAPAAELDAFLAARPEAQFFDLFFTNLCGVPRGKRLRRHEMAGAYRDGRFLPGSVLVVDTTGQDVEETGLVWADGDADRVAWPVPGTLAPALWLGPDSADVMLAMHELDGTPCELDPRAVLARVLARFAADGLTPVVACELEFYVLDALRTADGMAQFPLGPDGRRPDQHQAYGLDVVDMENAYLRDVWAACDALGLPTGAAISEYAPGQFEVTLAHKPDALGACDDAVRFKRAAKGVAANHGKVATFMAKPFADRSGSGLHIHVSVNDANGRNIFAADAPEGAPPLRHAIAGAALLAPESMALFAPNANSYRRFQRNSYAPLRMGWGINNRTVPLRIPAGPPGGRHLEHRIAGADANPYLAVAAVLAGIHHGLTGKLDPGPMISGDGYSAEGARLPTDWCAAVDRFDASTLLRRYFGDRTVEMFACVKRTEQERYNSVVTPLDYDWVLRSA